MTRARNLSSTERWASGVAASLLMSFSLKRGGLLGLIGVGAAAGLILRAGTGRCALKAVAEKETTHGRRHRHRGRTAAAPQDDIEMPRDRKDLEGAPGPLPVRPAAPFHSV